MPHCAEKITTESHAGAKSNRVFALTWGCAAKVIMVSQLTHKMHPWLYAQTLVVFSMYALSPSAAHFFASHLLDLLISDVGDIEKKKTSITCNCIFARFLASFFAWTLLHTCVHTNMHSHIERERERERERDLEIVCNCNHSQANHSKQIIGQGLLVPKAHQDASAHAHLASHFHTDAPFRLNMWATQQNKGKCSFWWQLTQASLSLLQWKQKADKQQHRVDMLVTTLTHLF